MSIITLPLATDVLCGKDKKFAQHEGNQIFRDLILEYSEYYMRAKTKQEKMHITKSIVARLKEMYQTRFLQPSSCGHWKEISVQIARDKVSHALRFAWKQSIKKGLPMHLQKAATPCRRKATCVSPSASSSVTDETATTNGPNTSESESDMDLSHSSMAHIPEHVSSGGYAFDQLRNEDLDELVLWENITSPDWDTASSEWDTCLDLTAAL
jgi:hypothetical protein